MSAVVRWPLLVARLCQRYPTRVVESATALRFVLAAPAGAARIGIRVHRMYCTTGEVAVVTADLGPADRIAPDLALELNATFAVGALAVDAGVLHLRCVIELAFVTDDQIETTIRRLAADAMAVKRQLTPVRSSSADLGRTFDYFGD